MSAAVDGPSAQYSFWFRHAGLAWLLAAAVSACPSQLPAQSVQPKLDAQHQLVLLKNGQVLEGTAISSLDRTVVETSSGSRIVLQTAQVDSICDSWEQAWEFRRDATDADRPDELVTLLRWCLRHRLFGRAWEVLDRLQWADLPASELESLRRQIALAEEAHRTAQLPRPAPQSPPATASSAALPDEMTEIVLPGEEPPGAIRPASFEEPTDETPGVGQVADRQVPTIAWPPAPAGGTGDTPARAAEPETARPLPRSPAMPEIPDLSRNGQQPFVPRDEFDPEIFNRFFREPGTWDGTPAAEIHRAARALGLPDLQPLIGKPKTPEK